MPLLVFTVVSAVLMAGSAIRTHRRRVAGYRAWLAGPGRIYWLMAASMGGGPRG